jgi:predicted lipoprotein
MQALQGSQQGLARELANSANAIRYRQADAMRGEWTQGLNRQQHDLDANYDMYRDERDFAANRFGLLTNALSTIQGGSQTQTGANPNYRSAGQNAATAAAMIAAMYGGKG